VKHQKSTYGQQAKQGMESAQQEMGILERSGHTKKYTDLLFISELPVIKTLASLEFY